MCVSSRCPPPNTCHVVWSVKPGETMPARAGSQPGQKRGLSGASRATRTRASGLPRSRETSSPVKPRARFHETSTQHH